jgi:hypothetical protein
MLPHDWPKLPIHPEHLPILRDLMTAEECSEMIELHRVHALDGPPPRVQHNTQARGSKCPNSVG